MIQEFVWFIIVYCFFTVGSVKCLQLLFVIFVGEELTVLGFVREECEKNFKNYCSRDCVVTGRRERFPTGCEYGSDILLKSNKCIVLPFVNSLSFHHYQRHNHNKADSTVNKKRDFLDVLVQV